MLIVEVDGSRLYSNKDAGNHVLATIERLVLGSLRRLDVAARNADGKYIVLLPATPKVGARVVAERTREMVQALSIANERLQSEGELAVSIGVATYPADARDAEELLLRTKEAAEIARASGKNQVHLHAHSSRSFRRVETSLDGSWRVLGSSPQPLTTLDVSEGGLLFLAERQVPVGALLEIVLVLPAARTEIGFAARVLQSGAHGIGEYEMAVSFVASSSRDQNMLARFVREHSPLTNAADPASKLV